MRVTGKAFPIKPSDVNTDVHFYETFDHLGTEIAANWIVRLCQERGDWGPFTRADVDSFYHRKFPGETFEFNRLIHPGACYTVRSYSMKGGGWIEEEGDLLYVTDDFINRCFNAGLKNRVSSR